MASQVIEAKKAELKKKEEPIQANLKESYELLGKMVSDNIGAPAIESIDMIPIEVIDSTKKLMAHIDQCKASLASIAKEKEELDSLKTCSKCGNIVGDDELFCASCGERIIRINSEVDGSLCPQCGKPKKDGAEFCVFCGFQYNKKRDSAEAIDSNVEKLSGFPPSPKPLRRVCIHCGTELANDVLFCHVCGTKQPN